MDLLLSHGNMWDIPLTERLAILKENNFYLKIFNSTIKKMATQSDE